MPARPAPDSPLSWVIAGDGVASGSSYVVVKGRNSSVAPPGSVRLPVSSSVSRCSVTGRAFADDSSLKRTPCADTIAVDGASAGKIASTRNPCSDVRAAKSSSKRSVASTTWASLITSLDVRSRAQRERPRQERERPRQERERPTQERERPTQERERPTQERE